MEELHDSRTERFRDDGSVMEHDDWAHSDEALTVGEVFQHQGVPGSFVLWCSIADCLVEDNVFLA